MSAVSINPSFPIFTDIDGKPLKNGFVFVGVPGLEASTNPKQAYWDEALTIPATQPVRTMNGYIVNNGTPAMLYTDGSDYSFRVNNKNGTLIYSTLNILQSNPFETRLDELAVSVKDFGAVGDGVADDTVALQAAIDSGEPNIYVPDGTYNYTSQLTINRRLRLFGPGTLNEVNLLEFGILVDGIDDVTIEGLTFTGPEDLAAWTGGGTAYRQAFKYFIRFLDCKNCTVNRIRSSGKRGTVQLQNCQKVLVQNVRHDGFLGDITTPQPDSNYYPVVNVNTGRENHVHSCEGFGCGSVVLLGTESSYNTISQITGRETHDNMIYNSSGNFSTFIGCVSHNSNGSGIKARGRAHTVTANVLIGSSVGIDVTGNGLTPDNFGANGYGTVVSANTVVASTSHGIKMGGQDGLLARDFVIIGNTVEAHLGVDGFCPIIAAGKRGIIVKGNIVRGFPSDYGINVSGISGEELPYCSIEGNVVQGGVDGIRCAYLNQSVISNNQGADLTGDFIDMRFCDDNTVAGNNAKDSNISATDTNPSTGNIFIGNKVALVSTNPLTNKLVIADFDHTFGGWSPTYETTGVDFDSVTLGTTQGFYVKNGKMVYVEGIIETSAVTVGAATGAAIIGGLPYVSSNAGAGAVAALSLARVSGFNVNHPSNGWVARNSDYIQLEYRTAANGNTNTLVPGDLAPGGINRIIFSGVYYTD